VQRTGPIGGKARPFGKRPHCSDAGTKPPRDPTGDRLLVPTSVAKALAALVRAAYADFGNVTANKE
jgi:hypothetical protein